MEDTKKLASAAEVIGESGKITVTLSTGQEVEIYKCKTRQVGIVLGLVAKLFDDMGVHKLGDIPNLDINNPVSLLQLIAKSATQVFTVAVELCSIEDVTKFEELEVDDSLAIIMKEFEVNKAFFLKRVLPQINL